MKRKRCDMEKKMTEIRSAVQEISTSFRIVETKNDNLEEAIIPTKSFLFVSTLMIQILDKIGPTMAVLRQDIDQNIQKLEKVYESDPSTYANLVNILKKEVIEGNVRKVTSCSRAFLWLTRSINFMVELLERLTRDDEQSMEQAVEEAYNVSLKPWHGWISSAAFKVALKLVPDSKTFMSLLRPKDESNEMLKEDIQTLVSLLLPILQHIRSLLTFYELDKIKST